MYDIDVGALYWGIGIFIFFIIVWFVIARILLKSEPKAVKVNLSDRYDDISEQELKGFGIDSNEFKRLAYKKFVDIHNALTNYDYEVLKNNLTNDLYQYYTEQLEILKKIKHKNVMDNFELVEVKLFNIFNEHDMLRIDVYLNVRMLDYVIDVDMNKCISGNDKEKIDMEFELCFEKRRKGCNINNQFVMSKKTCINDMEINENNKKDDK